MAPCWHSAPRTYSDHEMPAGSRNAHLPEKTGRKTFRQHEPDAEHSPRAAVRATAARTLAFSHLYSGAVADLFGGRRGLKLRSRAQGAGEGPSPTSSEVGVD
jgi:hypothetical protein